MPKEKFKSLISARRLNSHKGDYGHLFVLAGSPGLTGAAYLASRGALLSGSGLVTLGIPESLNPIMEVKLTEVMTKPLAETKKGTFSLRAFAQIRAILPKVNALAVGPGLSSNPQTQRLVHKILQTTALPLVLDADGLNALIGRLKVLDEVKSDLVITPHPGEMARLLNLKVAEVQKNRAKLAKDFAKKHNLAVVLKGYRTVVASRGGQVYINQTGNPGMASGGCGDVLTGIIASFLGQGMDPYSAAKLAVYVHGLAGDYAAKEKGEIGLTATDILDNLARAFQTVI